MPFACRLLSVLALLGVAGVARGQAHPSSSPQLKPPCRGLMTSGWGRLPPDDLDFVDCAAVNVPWRDLETADQKFDGPAWEKIEAARRRGLGIRLRVLCGIYAPDFVKQIGGVALSDPEHGIDCSKSGGVAIWNEFSRRGGATTCFWKPEVLNQYEQLITEVARRYESVPEVREVIDSACMTVFAEPFYRAHRNAGSNRRLAEAGLTFERDLAAHRRAIEIHDRLFRHTRTSLAVNPWDIVDDSPARHRTSWPETRQFVEWARTRMGQRLVLQNNGFFLDSEKALKQAPEVSHLAYLHAIAGPKGFQPRIAPKTEEEFFAVAELGIRFGANFFEFGGFGSYDRTRLREIDRRLEANLETNRQTTPSVK